MQRVVALIPDALIISGGIALSYGAGILHPAVGFITAGLLLIAGGVTAAKNAVRQKVAE